MWKNQQSDIINMKSKIQILNQSKMGYQKNPKLEIKNQRKTKIGNKNKKIENLIIKYIESKIWNPKFKNLKSEIRDPKSEI